MTSMGTCGGDTALSEFAQPRDKGERLRLCALGFTHLLDHLDRHIHDLRHLDAHFLDHLLDHWHLFDHHGAAMVHLLAHAERARARD